MNAKQILLEACVDSLEAALAAEAAGADRIELCAALELGGITPSVGLIRRVCGELSTPVQVLLRPRPGNFVYSEREMEVMLTDASMIALMGVSGIVTGALNEWGGLALEQMKQLNDVTAIVPLTFHRAFDHAQDPYKVTRQLIELGVERILSSGQQPTALQGAKLLGELQTEFGGEIKIMPGGGINAQNIVQIADLTGCREFHFSAVRSSHSPSTGPEVGKSGSGNACLVPDPEKVRQVREAFGTQANRD